ncbi:hypothetical protein OGCDGJMD_01216 [Cyanobium usitatum str. Tous]|uniref:hypothetical protein n=1 Tax=Cyanobium usitatum TaxID=2304190 RepID=UPI002AD4F0F6|nr:hypothetical protein [Cyanobium usitatum]CAK6692357.1 hypothetical protein OGCDGJMD_01216 [Cyanobium usitatum str. Tous]
MTEWVNGWPVKESPAPSTDGEDDETECWYECTFTYNKVEYQFRSDEPVAELYDEGRIDIDTLFQLAGEPVPEDIDEELFDGIGCTYVFYDAYGNEEVG